mgnify:CR=1 FL=1
MQLIRHSNDLPPARIFALGALPCAAVLQVHEAGHAHWHDLDAGHAQCLVCKNSEPAALPIQGLASITPG